MDAGTGTPSAVPPTPPRPQDRSQVDRAYRLPALRDRRQEQDLLLDVGREQRQVHHLRDARPGQPEAPGYVREVRGLAPVEYALEVMRLDKEARHARHATGGHLLGVRSLGQVCACQGRE